jgi:hypothetical protein
MRSHAIVTVAATFAAFVATRRDLRGKTFVA